jgi:RNA polymerase sigma-70 factor (ECF subfamily)
VSTVCVTDAELVRLAASGDGDAFGELVGRHQAAAFRAALAALRSRSDAEDATQDGFVMAFERLKSFRSESSFKTWLLTIVWHAAINRRRRITWWVRRTVEPAGEPEDAAAHTPEASAAGAEMRRAIAAEIRRLTPKLRDALLLATAGEYTYEEMAAMLKIPIGTLKWRVSEARRIVRKRLEARGHVVA